MNRLSLKILVALSLTVGGLWLHELVQAIPSPILVVDNALERSIPFLPWTIWIYFAFFVFIAATVFRVEGRLFWQFVVSTALAALIAWLIVVMFPITSIRPDPATIECDLYRRIFAFVHAADPHHITFPSLHVAVTWICNFLLWPRSGRGWRIALGIGISMSTLFTKQHIVPDVIAGILLALVCVWVTRRFAHYLPSRLEEPKS